MRSCDPLRWPAAFPFLAILYRPCDLPPFFCSALFHVVYTGIGCGVTSSGQLCTPNSGTLCACMSLGRKKIDTYNFPAIPAISRNFPLFRNFSQFFCNLRNFCNFRSFFPVHNFSARG
eukprot:EG_transcript_29360